VDGIVGQGVDQRPVDGVVHGGVEGVAGAVAIEGHEADTVGVLDVDAVLVLRRLSRLSRLFRRFRLPAHGRHS
jgi:hypothetical protein